MDNENLVTINKDYEVSESLNESNVPTELWVGDFRLTDRKVYFIKKIAHGEKEIFVSNQVCITALSENVETLTSSLEISFLNTKTMSIESLSVDYKDITNKKIIEDIRNHNGVICDENLFKNYLKLYIALVMNKDSVEQSIKGMFFDLRNTKSDVGEYQGYKCVTLEGNTDYQHILLSGKDMNISHSLTHNGLGWIDYRNNTCFRANDIFEKNEVIKSNYKGTMDITPVGELSNISTLIKDVIYGNIPMESIIAIAVAATLLPFADECWGYRIYNCIVHLMSTTSVGKSTAAILLTAFGSNPDEGAGFLLSHLDTQNALIRNIGDNRGIPVAVDEFSVGSKKDFSEVVYTLAMGKEKDRLKAGGIDIHKGNRFSTIVLSNGEVSILDYCSENQGLKARVIQIEGEDYTRSAEESDEIKRVMRKNYGLVTPLVAQELLENGGIWREKFEYWLISIKKDVEDKKIVLSIADRLSIYLALFMVSVEIAEKVLSVSLHQNEIYDFFFAHIITANAQVGSLGHLAYNVLLDYVKRHPNEFGYPDYNFGYEPNFFAGDYKGFMSVFQRKRAVNPLTGNKFTSYCLIHPKVVEGILNKSGFKSIKATLMDMQKNGFIASKQKGVFTVCEEINGQKINMIKLYVEEE